MKIQHAGIQNNVICRATYKLQSDMTEIWK